jgi:PadR family transcriptional regulator, regulatory protein PadR
MMDKNAVKGATTLLIMSLLDEQPMHGYELCRTIKTRSRGIFAFSEGTIYPLLYGMEEKGLVRGVWESAESARRRKVYNLTATGRKALQERRTQWARFQEGLNLALGDL